MNPASVERKEIIGLHRITKKILRDLCKKNQLYQTPELNEVLYLHYQGFQYIECLEEYTELKCLWLECNAISEIQGLENQTKLKCLFLQNNLIKCIENLEHCRELDMLNLASNHIRKIENCGVDILPALNTLNLSSNCLRDSESLRELEECKTLTVLDLANNRIDDILVVKIFAKMPQLRVLVLQGNPVVSKIPQYRKTLILECKELTYLDSRPVFPKDRACAEAWKRGGYNEERKEQERWNRRDRKKIRDSVNATIRMRNKHKHASEQMDLITSSDSETEEKRRKSVKELRENKTDPRLLIETGEDIDDDSNLLDIWDEVSGPNGVVPKVRYEDQTDVDESKAVENNAIQEVVVQSISTETKSSELTNIQNMETLECTDKSDILKVVENLNPINDGDDLPELISDDEININVKRKRPLIEEIDGEVASIGGKKKLIIKGSQCEEDERKNTEVMKVNANEEGTEGQQKVLNADGEQINSMSNTGAIKKRFRIEEFYDKKTVLQPIQNKAAEFLKTDQSFNYEKFKTPLKEKTVKKPLWIEEIFNQSSTVTSFPILVESTTNKTLNSDNNSFKSDAKLRLVDELDALKVEAEEQADFTKTVQAAISGSICIKENFAEPLIEISGAAVLQDTAEENNIELVHAEQPVSLIEEISEGTTLSNENFLVEAKELFEKSSLTKKLCQSPVDIDLNSKSKEIHQVENPTFLELAENPLLLLNSVAKDTEIGLDMLRGNPLLIEEIREPLKDTYFKSYVESANAINLMKENRFSFEKNKISENTKKHNAEDFKEIPKQPLLIEEIVEEIKITSRKESFDNENDKGILIEEMNLDSKKKTALEDFVISEDSAGIKVSTLPDDIKTGQSFKKSDSESELSDAFDELSSETSTDNEDSSYEKPTTSKSTSITDTFMEVKKKPNYSYKPPSSTDTESEDEAEKLQYNAAADAICDAVMSRVGSHEQQLPEKPNFVSTEGIETLVENYEPELEMEKMLERLPNDESEERDKRMQVDDENAEELTVKTAEEIKYEEECAEINRQVVKDFEALNANMEFYIEQFQQEQQQINGALKIEQDIQEVDHSHATVIEKIVQNKQISFEKRKAENDVQFDVVYEATTIIKAEVMLETGNQVMNEELTTAEVDKSQLETIEKVGQTEHIKLKESEIETSMHFDVLYEKTKNTEMLEVKESPLNLADKNELINACGDHIGIGKNKEKLPFLDLEEVLQRPTLKMYEQESIELQTLLKKLELQNEKLTFVKKSCNELLMAEQQSISDEEKTEDSYHDAEDNFENDTEMVNGVISELVSDVVEKEVEKELNKSPKNYVITDLESDEEYSYSGPAKPEEPQVKSIGSVLGAFNNLIQEIARKNREERKHQMMAYEPSSEAAKLSSLQTLLETPSLLEHHKSSYEQLKPQVDVIKKQSTHELKQMVERVYAQKDKYDDSLEVIDGRLVVIKKETGEVRELSEHKQSNNGIDSDSDESNVSADEYETAHSSNETEEEKKSKNLIWDFSMGATKPHTWTPKYRPTMRKSAEQLILNALECNEATLKLNENNDEDNEADETDGQKTLRKNDSKPSVFSNIDEEFFKNLDFKKIAEESVQDENFVEIARSYEELRQIIKQSGVETARAMISTEEQCIMEKLESSDVIKDAANEHTKDELIQEGDLLMHKLVQRTKEAKERGEDNLISEADPNDKPYIIKDTQMEHESCEVNCLLTGYPESKHEIVVEETSSASTLLFEMEPAESTQHLKVVKMLKKLQIDHPLAQEILQEVKAPDIGDFTAPLEINFDKLRLEEELKMAQLSHEKKFAEYTKIKLEKQFNIECNEVAIQCEPNSFDGTKHISDLASESAKESVLATLMADTENEENVIQIATQVALIDNLDEISSIQASEVTEI